MGVNFVFVSGVGKNSLKKGPGHYDGSPLPGLPGTVSIAGHRTTYSAPFRRMNKLRRGDKITLTMPYGRFTYRVEGLRVVLPQNTGVLKTRPPQPSGAHDVHPRRQRGQAPRHHRPPGARGRAGAGRHARADAARRASLGRA